MGPPFDNTSPSQAATRGWVSCFVWLLIVGCWLLVLVRWLVVGGCMVVGRWVVVGYCDLVGWLASATTSASQATAAG
jgi:hypothetical protein